MSRKKKQTGITRIKKRDGRLVRFSPKKIERAMGGAFKAAGEYDEKVVRQLTKKIVMEMEKRFNRTIIPEVEQAQDLIEKTLIKEGYEKVHKSFKLYRELHRKLRDIDSLVDSDELIENYLMDGEVKFKALVKEGSLVKKGTSIVLLKAKAVSILKAERVALNFLQRLF